MRLISLKLKNYRQFKDAEVEFADGVTGIVGLNGAGKSTIIEAIAWALYGNIAARTEKQGIKRTGAPLGSSVEVTLEIEVSGSQYQIVRVLKGSSQMGAGSMITGGRVIADSVKGMDKEVEFLLGMDFSSFKTSFLAKQKELNALTDLKPAERKEVIIRMLGIDSIDKAIIEIRKQIRENKMAAEIRRKSLKNDDSLASEKQSLANDLSKIKKKVSEAESEIDKLEKEMTAYTEKFNSERKIYETHTKLERELGEAKARLTGLSKREKELLKEIEQAEKFEKELNELKKAYDEYEDRKDRANKYSASVEKQLERIDEKLGEMRAEYREIQEKEKVLKEGEPCPTCGQPLKDFKKIKEHFAEEKAMLKADGEKLTKQKETLEKWKKKGERPDKEITADLKIDIKEIDENEKALGRLKPLAERFPFIQAKAEQLKGFKDSLKELKKEKAEFDEEIERASKELKAIPFDSKEHDQITEEFNRSKVILDGKYHERNDLRVSLGRIEGELLAKDKEIKENKGVRDKIKEEDRLQEDRNRLAEIMAEYRTHIIARIQPELAEISGRLFTELTNGKYQGVELDEDYEMHIYDGGAKYPLSRFSGGEADLANLCLRLAISQLISSSTGAETGFIILDEIFGSQDPIRKNAILEALASLSRRFRQILLITHVDDIKDGLENIIEVAEDESGVSTVKQ